MRYRRGLHAAETSERAAPAIEARGLTRRFGRSVAVDALDLRVERGRIFGFLGPNGAGKTTTIRMLAGVLAPSAGEARILGLDLGRERDAIKQRIGYVSQQFGLYADLTVAENVRFYADLYAPHADRANLDRRAALLERYGLTRYRDTPARALSGGYRQRLALVTAITHEPELVFLDEPTAGVDPVTRKELWDLFYELTDAGATLFVTTHYMEEAERCDRLALLADGRKILEDTPEGVCGALDGRDLFVVESRYDRERIERARRLDGVETLNQFGATLRVIAREGLLDADSLAHALGLDASAVTRGRPSIEDVFVNLTQPRRPSESAP